MTVNIGLIKFLSISDIYLFQHFPFYLQLSGLRSAEILSKKTFSWSPFVAVLSGCQLSCNIYQSNVNPLSCNFHLFHLLFLFAIFVQTKGVFIDNCKTRVIFFDTVVSKTGPVVIYRACTNNIQAGATWAGRRKTISINEIFFNPCPQSTYCNHSTSH